nr:hypothetical protein [Serratia sp. FDAARGOS_506]
MGFLLRPAMPAPAADAAEEIRFLAGHKPPGFAGCLLLLGIALGCRVLLSNTMMLTQIISEHPMSDRLFASCRK